MSIEKSIKTDHIDHEKLSEQTEHLSPHTETLYELESLEKDTHTHLQKQQLKKEIQDNIDLTDGVSEEEVMYMHIVEDFFEGFLADRGVDDVSDDTKKMLLSRIQNNGYTIANLDMLAQNLHKQNTSQEQGEMTQNERIQKMLMAAMGGYLLDQIDMTQNTSSLHEQCILLMQLQQYVDDLDEEQKERKRKMREKLLADLFEWKNLEIYEVVIDASGCIVITMKDPQGEMVTISYDPLNGAIDRIDAGSISDIMPADQTKIAQIMEKIHNQQSLPYDPHDTGTLLQFVSGKL